MADPVLHLDGVGKRFGGVQALDGVTLSVPPGEQLALLGHNGAGKSTLLKIVLGLIGADDGTTTVAGKPAGSMRARACTAYLPEAVSFHGSLTGREQLTLFARLAGTPVADVAALLDKVGLGGAADRRIRTYSKGMRQRLGMAQVMLGRPSLALLDEPTSGLDPISRQDFYAMVDDMAALGTAVVITSHALTEIAPQADRIAILASGQLVAHDTLDRLARAAQLKTRIQVQAVGDAETVHRAIGGTRINCAKVEITCEADDKIARLAQIAALGGQIEDLEIVPPSLDDLYRHYASRSAKP